MIKNILIITILMAFGYSTQTAEKLNYTEIKDFTFYENGKIKTRV